MRRALVMLTILRAAACGGGPTAPEPPAAAFRGAYVLGIDPSRTCSGLIARQLRWDVVATTGADEALIVDRDDTVRLRLVLMAGRRVDGILSLDGAPVAGTDLRASSEAATVKGEIAVGVGGGGEVRNGVLFGRIEVDGGEGWAECDAADHSWSLLPR